MSSFRVIGSRTPMVGSPVKVSGQAKFATDMNFPGLLHGKVLRSVHSHARILKIDTSEALKVPGVKTIVTGQDIPPGAGFGTLRKDQTALAINKVGFIGHEVAAVAAVSREVAEEAIDRIKVEYETLPAYLTPEDAMADDAHLIHDDAPNNICHELDFQKGENLEATFAASDIVLEEEFIVKTQYHAFTEPNCTVADPTDGNKLVMYVPCQKVFLGRDRIAMGLGLETSKVRLVQPYVGGSFGGKSIDDPNALINGLLAMKSGRPVKLENLRTESFRGATRMRVPAKVQLKIGAMNDGTLTAHSLNIVAECGGHAGASPGIVNTMVTRWPSLYRWKACGVKAKLMYTNNPPKGAFRGFGTPQTTVPGEIMMDILAEQLDIDPPDLRLQNVLNPGELSIHKWNAITNALPECVERAVEMTDWKHKREETRQSNSGTRRRGIGLACANHVSGNRVIAGWEGSTAILHAHDDGRIGLLIGEGDNGQGAPTVLSMFAAEELGVDVKDIDMCEPDTDVAPYTLGSFASRITMIGGNAVHKAAVELKKKLGAVVSKEYEVDSDDLTFEQGRIFVKGSPDRGMSIGEAVKKEQNSGGPVMAVGHYEAENETIRPPLLDGNVAPGYEFVAQIAEVEVDIETGQVDILEFVTVDDVGRVISALGAESQTEGAISQGLGWAYFEEMVFENGQPVNGNLADYNVPNAEAMPPIRHDFIESDDPLGPLGAKGCSEGPVNPVAAAIANAIYDAVGVRCHKVPIRPQDLLKAIREKGIASNGS